MVNGTTILLNEVLYIVKSIFYFEKITEWDYEDNCLVFGIKLNEIPDEAKRIPLYANKKILYDSIEDRDTDFESLKELLNQDS
jgi:hypothetical protein